MYTYLHSSFYQWCGVHVCVCVREHMHRLFRAVLKAVPLYFLYNFNFETSGLHPQILTFTKESTRESSNKAFWGVLIFLVICLGSTSIYNQLVPSRVIVSAYWSLSSVIYKSQKSLQLTLSRLKGCHLFHSDRRTWVFSLSPQFWHISCLLSALSSP